MSGLLLLVTLLGTGPTPVLEPQVIHKIKSRQPVKAVFLKYGQFDFDYEMSPPPGSVSVARPLVGQASSAKVALVPSTPTKPWTPASGRSWWAVLLLLLLIGLAIGSVIATVGGKTKQRAMAGSLLFVASGSTLVLLFFNHP